MSNTIKLKRGSGSDPSASDLVVGELAIRTDSGKIFTKKDNGSVAEISGGGGIDDGDKGDITISNGGDTFTIDNGVVTSAKIADGTIVNADINASAAIAGSKISPTFTSNFTASGTEHKFTSGTSGDCKVIIEADSDNSNENDNPKLIFRQDGGIDVSAIGNNFSGSDTSGNELFIANSVVNGGMGFYTGTSNGFTNGTARLKIAGNGQVDFFGNVDCNAGLDVTGNITTSTGDVQINGGDLDINHTHPRINFNDSNANPDWSIINNNGNLGIYDVTGGAYKFQIATSGETQALDGLSVTGDITTTGDIRVPDDKSVFIGGSEKFQLTHRSSDNVSILSETGGGDLSIETNGSQAHFYDKTNGRIMASFATGGACSFKHGATTRLATTSTGVSVTGNIVVSGTVDGVDIATRNTLFGGLTSSSGVLSNGVTATTQGASDNTTKVATTAYVTTAISNLINNAPSALDTLKELSDALGSDANFSTTVTNSIATKMPLAGGTFSGNVSFGDNNITNVGTIALDTIKGDADDNTNINFAGSDIVNIKPAGTTRLQINTSGINVTGAISVSGTVDGRDIASDGSKLDGIESGATADQSASEILTLIKTVDGAGSGLDADKLDGISSASFLRSDADDSFNGTIVAQSDQTNPVIKITGSGPNFIQFATDSSGTVDADSINLIYRTTPNTLAFERASDAFTMFSVDADNSQAIFSGNLDVGAGVDVTGNITVSGNVDGRDLASDGSKLDGIESNATADQTASEILTLLKTVDGSGSGLDADLLDGISSASFLRSDAADSSSANITINGLEAGSWVLSSSFKGIFHTSQTDSEYMMISNDTHTFISATTGHSVYIRPSGNSSTNQLIVSTSGVTIGGNTVLTSASSLNASNISSGTLGAARLGVASTSESGVSATGNFGQYESHGTYNNFNTEPAYWGWNFVQGTTNAPNSTSSQWYRCRLSLGSDYGKGSDGGDYSLEMALPRNNHASAGVLHIRSIENGSEGSWTTVGNNASLISTGTLPAARLPNHSAALLTSGTIPAARVPTLNQNTTGNAATATKLATARTIAGVSFDGSANISLNNNAITNGAGYITSADGGNANALDGLDSSQFARSDADDTLSGSITLSKNTTDVINFSANSTNLNRGIAFNSKTALSAHYNDGWLRINNNGEFTNGVFTPLKIRADQGFHVGVTTVINGNAQVVASRLTGALPAIDGSNLTGISAGATGGGSDEVFWCNGQTVTANFTIPNGKNAMSAGPIEIQNGVTVTVGSGENWTVV